MDLQHSQLPAFNHNTDSANCKSTSVLHSVTLIIPQFHHLARCQSPCSLSEIKWAFALLSLLQVSSSSLRFHYEIYLMVLSMYRPSQIRTQVTEKSLTLIIPSFRQLVWAFGPIWVFQLFQSKRCRPINAPLIKQTKNNHRRFSCSFLRIKWAFAPFNSSLSCFRHHWALIHS